MKKSISLLILLVFITIISCSKNANNLSEEKYWIKVVSCDFENYSHTNKNLFTFKTDSSTFNLSIYGSPNTKSSKSGSTSALIHPTNSKPTFTLSNIDKGQLIEISIWQKQGDTLAYLKANSYFQGKIINTSKTNYNSLGKAKDGWEQHFLSLTPSQKIDSISVYLHGQQTNSYFDDLKIYIYPLQAKNNVANELNLVVNEKNKKKLTRYIEKSMHHKVISEDSKNYVKAKYISGSDSVKMKMKIKGDWSDHIFPQKPSYRINLPSSSSYLGMRSFAVQHPKVRNYLSEWLMHKVADKIDLISTKYEFVNVIINNYHLGIYAVEEHFDKHIVENRKRREGPILKFNENGTWKYREEIHKRNLKHLYPDYEASYIDAFKLNRILKSIMLTKQFEEGIKLLQLFRQGHLNVEDIFDIDQIAKFYVLIELSGNYHSLSWHNRRFYFNPVTQKLEPIFFDVIPYFNKQDNITEKMLTNADKEPNLFMDNALLLNEEFKDKFFYYLNEYTKESFWQEIFNEHEDALVIYEDAIKGENHGYEFSTETVLKRVNRVKKSADKLLETWNEQILKANSPNYWMKPTEYFSNKDLKVIEGINVNAYIEKKANSWSILVENFHVNPIEIIAIQYKNNTPPTPMEGKVLLKGYSSVQDSIRLKLKEKPFAIIFIDTYNPNELHYAQIIPWAKPSGSSVLMKLKSEFKAKRTKFKLTENEIVFSEDCTIDFLFYVPKKYEVIVKPGVRINFSTGGGLIVNNNFTCVGTESKPIYFTCEDSSSQGITILKAHTVNIENANFVGLSNLNYKNWQITGSLSIYESTTNLKNVSIRNNISEDALNIIRSDFRISGLIVENTLSDGFDADFCTGIIENSKFKNTGNDCIDFSGSEVIIKNIDIESSGDKGISGGEASKLQVSNIFINGARMGIASKDGSVINATDVNIMNSDYLFASFQKKSTYGPSKLTINDYQESILKSKVLVEKGSFVSINNKIFQGEKMLNIDELYKDFVKF